MLSSNFNEKVKEFIASDEAFTFMNSIKGTSLFEKVFVLCFGHLAVRSRNIFYDTLICRFEME